MRYKEKPNYFSYRQLPKLSDQECSVLYKFTKSIVIHCFVQIQNLISHLKRTITTEGI
jgi:hypothetical protein